MIGPDDGWCINFDKEKRICTIYEDRPEFCRVDTKSYKKMYGIEGKFSPAKLCRADLSNFTLSGRLHLFTDLCYQMFKFRG